METLLVWRRPEVCLIHSAGCCIEKVPEVGGHPKSKIWAARYLQATSSLEYSFLHTSPHYEDIDLVEDAEDVDSKRLRYM
jgi:hypothetical protein